MDIHKIRVGKNGRITIPVAIRRKLNLHPGDRVIFEQQPDKRLILKKSPAPETKSHELTGSAPKQ